jgi:hypothetical protein
MYSEFIIFKAKPYKSNSSRASDGLNYVNIIFRTSNYTLFAFYPLSKSYRLDLSFNLSLVSISINSEKVFSNLMSMRLLVQDWSNL